MLAISPLDEKMAAVKTILLLQVFLCLALVLATDVASASVMEFQILPNSSEPMPAIVQVTNGDFGWRFVVLYKTNETTVDEFLDARLDVSSADNRIASCPVAKRWTSNGVRFDFEVAAADVLASRFTINEWGHAGKRPMPSVSSFWFYLRDFATNTLTISPRPDEVPPALIKGLPRRVRALHPGLSSGEVWKRLKLEAYKGNLAGEHGVEHDQSWLTWNYEIEFTFEKTPVRYASERDGRKLIEAVLYKNGMIICRSRK